MQWLWQLLRFSSLTGAEKHKPMPSFLFPFLLKNSCSSSPFPGPVTPSSFGVIYTSELFLSQGIFGLRSFFQYQQDAEQCPVLLQVGAQQSKQRGKEGTGCQPWCTGLAVSLLGGRATLCSGKSPSPHRDPAVTWILATAAPCAGYSLPCARLNFCPLPRLTASAERS